MRGPGCNLLIFYLIVVMQVIIASTGCLHMSILEPDAGVMHLCRRQEGANASS